MRCFLSFLTLVAVCLAGSVAMEYGPVACPCEKVEFCSPITGEPEKQVLGFVVNQNNWKRYNWTHITTLVMFTDLPPELMCYAHSKGVRIILGGLNGFRVANLTNTTIRSTWIQTQLKNVQNTFTDGLNIDIEEPVKNGSVEMKLLTQFVGEIYQAFKGANKNYQITYDVAWSPNCTDGRCYEVDKFVPVTDFVIVMAYDEQSQIYGPCVAKANSPLLKTELGIKQYLDMGVPADHMLLGLPWYGYDYPCISLSSDHVCTIPKVPYQGVPCSDAAGTQHDYSDIHKLIRQSTAIIRWNETFVSPFFDHKVNQTEHQVWFDNPESLSHKYSFAKQSNLLGLAFWNIDSLDYISSAGASKETAEMWQALDVFFN